MAKKQIPFRYPEELDKDFADLFQLQGYTQKRNKALIDAVRIAAEVVRQCSKGLEDTSSWNRSYKLEENIQKMVNAQHQQGVVSIAKTMEAARDVTRAQTRVEMLEEILKSF